MAMKYKNIPEIGKEFCIYLEMMLTNIIKMEYKVLTILGNLIIDDFIIT